MYLKKFKLINFRKFAEKENEIEFTDSQGIKKAENGSINIASTTTLLVGKNNSGKTTVFEALDKLINGNSDSNSKFTFDDFNYEYIKNLIEEYGNDKYDVLPSIEFVFTIGLDKGKEDLIVNLGYFIPIGYDADIRWYGCMEVWMIALGYDNQKLKINENIILELVDESGNIINETDKPGNIVVTSLCQRGMPFIRYKLTDKAIFLDDNKKFIKLIPNEDRIIKTKLYGNRVFKDIICYINSHYKINYFEKIRVVQKENQDFFVYISNCSGAQEQLKKAFIKSFDLFVPNYKKNINFIFENYDNENLFKVEINEKR